jgi:hypothetical protein
VPIIPALRKLRQEECEFEASLGCVAKHCFKKKEKKEERKERRKEGREEGREKMEGGRKKRKKHRKKQFI